MSRQFFGVEAMVVGPGLKSGMPILYEAPREVGADRIVNAVAAFELYGGPCIVVDFGTATTFDAISARGEYLGGAICPGIGISAEALFQRAAKLPRVEISRPKSVIGRNTVHSMQSGLYFGYLSLVEGLVARMREELEGKPKVDRHRRPGRPAAGRVPPGGPPRPLAHADRSAHPLRAEPVGLAVLGNWAVGRLGSESERISCLAINCLLLLWRRQASVGGQTLVYCPPEIQTRTRRGWES